MNTESDLRPGIVFERTRPLEELPADLRLPNAAWGVLFAVTGEHTVAQVGEHLGLSTAARDAAFARLLEHDLVAERPLTLGEYARAAASIGDNLPRSLAEFLASGVRPAAAGVTPRERDEPRSPWARAASPTTSPATSPTASSMAGPDMNATRAIPVRFVPRPETIPPVPPALSPPVPSPPVPSPTFQPLSEPSGPVPTVETPGTESGNGENGHAAGSGSRLSLRALMQFILDRAPDLNAGQLDVYRVFIRVDTKLLKRNGITTLRFEEDRLIGDPELQDAITSSLERTLGLNAPRDVFV